MYSSGEITKSTMTAFPRDEERESGGERWFAAAGAAGALLASSCCILPLLLVTMGASGTWIGSLTALEPYKPYVLAVTFPLLGIGFWKVYRKPVTQCAQGTYCASPWAARLTKTALWLVSLLAASAATINYWGPLLY